MDYPRGRLARLVGIEAVIFNRLNGKRDIQKRVVRYSAPPKNVMLRCFVDWNEGRRYRKALEGAHDNHR